MTKIHRNNSNEKLKRKQHSKWNSIKTGINK